jgi:hypothetical protein
MKFQGKCFFRKHSIFIMYVYISYIYVLLNHLVNNILVQNFLNWQFQILKKTFKNLPITSAMSHCHK